MFIATILHRIFGKKTKKVEIAKDEKQLLKVSSESCENFHSLATPTQINAYELDLKLLKLRHQKNCKNINPSSSLKKIKKSQHQSRSKLVKSYSSPEKKRHHQSNIILYPGLQPILRVHTAKKMMVQRSPTYHYVFKRTPVIRRKKFPSSK